MKKRLSFISSAILVGAIAGNIKAQAPTFQIIHNCADAAAANVKIWANGGVLVNNLAFRFATATGTVAAGTYTIGVSAPSATTQAASLAQFTVNLATGVDYKIVANGIVSPTGYNPSSMMAPFTLSTFTSNAAAPSSSITQVLVNHGSTDAPVVDVVAPFTGTNPVFPNILVNNAAYTNFAGWLNLTTANYKLQVRDQFSENVVQEYSAPLTTLGLGGQRISVIASGFLNTTNNSNSPNSFGLWVATATGGSLIPLPTTTTTSTRLQAIHNCADAAATSVDVWFRSATTGTAAVLLLDNFAFRTASPFIDVPTAQVVTLSIAPPTSTSVASALANFTYNLAPSSKYQLIASGILSPLGYSPSSTAAPFSLIANANVRERALVNSNTDVLIFHGATDAPAVNIVSPPSTTLASALTYSNYNSIGYNALPTANYTVNVNSGSVTVASYQAPLAALSLTGQAITVLASGFLTPASNSNGPAFGLFAAAATGGSLIPLPSIVITAIGNKTELQNKLSVYPNPFSERVTISNQSELNLTIEVSDITGKLIKSVQSNESSISMDLNELTTGVYFITVNNGADKATFKVVK
jgi:hypothetical protein